MNSELFRDLADRYTYLDAAVRGEVMDPVVVLNRYAFAYPHVTKDGKGPGLRLAHFGAVDSVSKAMAEESPNNPIWFTTTVYDVDRDGDVVYPPGIETENYERNPVIDFGHYETLAVPIAKGVDDTGRLLWVNEENRSRGGALFDPRDADAQFIRSKVLRGYLSAASIAFVPLEASKREPELHKAQPRHHGSQPLGYLFKRVDLTGFAIVAVPANASALRDTMDREKSFVSPQLFKAMSPYCAKSTNEAGGCWTGWCPTTKGCMPCKGTGEKSVPVNRDESLPAFGDRKVGEKFSIDTGGGQLVQGQKVSDQGFKRDDNQKTILVSQWTRTTKSLSSQKSHVGTRAVAGQVTKSARQAEADKFLATLWQRGTKTDISPNMRTVPTSKVQGLLNKSDTITPSDVDSGMVNFLSSGKYEINRFSAGYIIRQKSLSQKSVEDDEETKDVQVIPHRGRYTVAYVGSTRPLYGNDVTFPTYESAWEWAVGQKINPVKSVRRGKGLVSRLKNFPTSVGVNRPQGLSRTKTVGVPHERGGVTKSAGVEQDDDGWYCVDYSGIQEPVGPYRDQTTADLKLRHLKLTGWPDRHSTAGSGNRLEGLAKGSFDRPIKPTDKPSSDPRVTVQLPREGAKVDLDGQPGEVINRRFDTVDVRLDSGKVVERVKPERLKVKSLAKGSYASAATTMQFRDGEKVAATRRILYPGSTTEYFAKPGDRLTVVSVAGVYGTQVVCENDKGVRMPLMGGQDVRKLSAKGLASRLFVLKGTVSGPCKPGQSAARTGCTPSSGSSGKKPAGSGDKPSSGSEGGSKPAKKPPADTGLSVPVESFFKNKIEELSAGKSLAPNDFALLKKNTPALKVADLKAGLKGLGVATTGTKAVLAGRMASELAKKELQQHPPKDAPKDAAEVKVAETKAAKQIGHAEPPPSKELEAKYADRPGMLGRIASVVGRGLFEVARGGALAFTAINMPLATPVVAAVLYPGWAMLIAGSVGHAAVSALDSGKGYTSPVTKAEGDDSAEPTTDEVTLEDTKAFLEDRLQQVTDDSKQVEFIQSLLDDDDALENFHQSLKGTDMAGKQSKGWFGSSTVADKNGDKVKVGDRVEVMENGRRMGQTVASISGNMVTFQDGFSIQADQVTLRKSAHRTVTKARDPVEVMNAGFPRFVEDADDRERLERAAPNELRAWRQAVADHNSMTETSQKLSHRRMLEAAWQALKRKYDTMVRGKSGKSVKKHACSGTCTAAHKCGKCAAKKAMPRFVTINGTRYKSTSSDVRSPTETSTSTEAYTADNFTATVTGGAGDGNTTVNIYLTYPDDPDGGDQREATIEAAEKKLGAMGVAGASESQMAKMRQQIADLKDPTKPLVGTSSVGLRKTVKRTKALGESNGHSGGYIVEDEMKTKRTRTKAEGDEFGDDPEVEEMSDTDDVDMDLPPAEPKHGSQVLASLHNHLKAAQDYVGEECARMDHPGLAEALTGHKGIGKTMEDIEAMHAKNYPEDDFQAAKDFVAGGSGADPNQGLEGEDAYTEMAEDDEVTMEDDPVETSEDEEFIDDPDVEEMAEITDDDMADEEDVAAEEENADGEGADAAAEEILDRYRQPPKRVKRPVQKRSDRVKGIDPDTGLDYSRVWITDVTERSGGRKFNVNVDGKVVVQGIPTKKQALERAREEMSKLKLGKGLRGAKGSRKVAPARRYAKSAQVVTDGHGWSVLVDGKKVDGPFYDRDAAEMAKREQEQEIRRQQQYGDKSYAKGQQCMAETHEFLQSLADNEDDPVKRAALSHHAQRTKDEMDSLPELPMGEDEEALPGEGVAKGDGDLEEELEDVGKAVGDGDLDEELEDVQKAGDGDLEEEEEAVRNKRDVRKSDHWRVVGPAPFEVRLGSGFTYGEMSGNGKPVQFKTREEAQRKADELNKIPKKSLTNGKVKRRVVPNAIEREFNQIKNMLARRTGYRG